MFQLVKLGPCSLKFHTVDADAIKTALASRQSTLVSVETNLVDAIWNDRPPRPDNPVFHLDEKYSGQLQPALSMLVVDSPPGKSPAVKIAAVREELEKKKYQAVVVTMLDEVAWLFNLRGSDIDFNPGVLL